MATASLLSLHPSTAAAVRPLPLSSPRSLSVSISPRVPKGAPALPPIAASPVLRRSFCGARRISVRCSAVVTIGQSEFAAAVLESELPVLVEFVADWCGPCRLISPVIEWASQEYQGKVKIVKIDHDANPELIEAYKVYGLPALILFKNGKEVPESRREGAITKAKLKEYLDSLLESKTTV